MQPLREQGIGVVIDVPTMTAEQYEVVVARLGWTGEAASVPDGLLVHAAGPSAAGWRIVDLWRDEQSFRRFSSTAVVAAVEGLGLPAYEPQVFPVQHSIGMPSGSDRRVGRPPSV